MARAYWICGIAAAFGFGFAAQAGTGIDLVADFDPNTGFVSVTNEGDTAAGASVLVFECFKRFHGVCDESRRMTGYQHAQFPGEVALDVPALAAGETFKHMFSFWPSVKRQLSTGHYVFKLLADEGKAVGESDEINNLKRVHFKLRTPN